MTTSWSHYVRGQWVSSIRVNPGGFMLAVLASAVSIAAIRVGFSGVPVAPQSMRLLAIGLIGAMTAAVIDWIMRLV